MLKFLWRYLILALLIISLVFNFWLFKKLNFAYLKINDLNVNPVNLKYYPTSDLDKTAETTKDKIRVVFFGDSRSEQWLSPTLRGFEFINRGIGGETTGQSYLRFQDHISYLKPNIIVVQFGVNDLRMKPLPAIPYQDIVINCQNNVLKIIQKAEKISAKVIVTTLFPLADQPLPQQWLVTWASLPEIEAGIQSVNQFIYTLTSLKNVSVLDAYTLLQESGKVKKEYARDLLHLNQKGYELLNQKLIQLLKTSEIEANS